MIVISAPLKPFSRSARALNAGGIDERDSMKTYADLARWARCPSTARVQLLFLDPIYVMAGVLPAGNDTLYSSETELTGADETCFLRRAVQPNNSEKCLVAKPSSTDD